MSIINDALKKTQENFDKNGNSEKKETPEKNENPEKKETSEKPAEQKSSMANIYDKLHKQNRPSEATSAHPAQKQAQKTTKAPSSGKQANPFQVFLILLLLLGLSGAALYMYFPEHFSFTKNIPMLSRPITAPKPVPQRTYENNEIVLNGTTLLENKRVALINGNIYEVGQSIEGKTIKKINLNEVELLDGESTLILTVGKSLKF